MKTKLSILASLLFALMLSVHAQQPMQHRTVEERVKAVMDKISDPLKLDKTEQDKTTAVFTGYYTSQNKMREDARAGGTRPDRTAMEKLVNDRDEKLKSIFTDEQFKKFKDEIESTLRPQRPQEMQHSTNS